MRKITKFDSQNTTNQNLTKPDYSTNLRQPQIPQITKINDGIAGFLVAKSLWMAAKKLVNFLFAAPKEEKNKETANQPSKNETYFIDAKSFFEIAKIHQNKGDHAKAIENLNYATKEIGDKTKFADKILN